MCHSRPYRYTQMNIRNTTKILRNTSEKNFDDFFDNFDFFYLHQVNVL